VGPRRLPKCTLKSIKIDIWPSVCPLGAPLDPMITKMMPQVPKIHPEGLQNDNLRYKKTSISVVNQPAAPCIQGGRRQGRSLKIRRTPRRGAAGRDGIATEVLAETRIQRAPPLPPTPSAASPWRARKASKFRTAQKTARELQKGLPFGSLRAPRIDKSARKRHPRAPLDAFRK